MKRLAIFLLSLCFFVNAFAQQNHFIYVQTDNRQPFYVKVNGKHISSSLTGYAIISKLNKGRYELHFGFPKNEWPEQVINLDVTGDGGFLLKNFQEKGWGLYNMQTMDVVMNNKVPATTEPVVAAAAPASQPAQVAAGTPPEIPLETAAIPAPTTQAVASNPTPAPQTTTVNQVPPPARDVPAATNTTTASTQTQSATDSNNSDVKKLYSINEPDGKAVVYVDNPPQYKDTVKIVLKKDEPITTASAPAANTTGQVKPATDGRFLDIDMNGTNAGQPAAATPAEATVSSETKPKKQRTSKKANEPYVPVTTEQSLEFPADGTAAANTKTVETPRLSFNSDCKVLATEDDFFKVRKKMVNERNEQGMTDEAVKYFRTKCFTAEQVRMLAVLYLTDEGRYKLFDAAYPFISDTQNFPKLESELKDEYYQGRFRAMIRK